MTNRELRSFHRSVLSNIESRCHCPTGAVLARYARVVAGMERHLEVKIISDKETRDDH